MGLTLGNRWALETWSPCAPSPAGNKPGTQPRERWWPGFPGPHKGSWDPGGKPVVFSKPLFLAF